MKRLNEIIPSCHSSMGGKYLMILLRESYDHTGNGMVLHKKWHQGHSSAKKLKFKSQPGR